MAKDYKFGKSIAWWAALLMLSVAIAFTLKTCPAALAACVLWGRLGAK